MPAKWRPFCLGPNVLRMDQNEYLVIKEQLFTPNSQHIRESSFIFKYMSAQCPTCVQRPDSTQIFRQGGP